MAPDRKPQWGLFWGGNHCCGNCGVLGERVGAILCAEVNDLTDEEISFLLKLEILHFFLKFAEDVFPWLLSMCYDSLDF